MVLIIDVVQLFLIMQLKGQGINISGARKSFTEKRTAELINSVIS